jgi:ABC-2 type transport system permease protein
MHLLKIDLKKLTNYTTFWVVSGLYFTTLIFFTGSGMEFLKMLVRLGAKFGTDININRIPLYHFPDVWQNIVYVSGFFKVMLAILVVISITNEFSYRTIRQNIIDGLSRWEFLKTKIFTNLLLSLMSAVVIFLIGLVTGLIYTPQVQWHDVFSDLEFIPAYSLEVFTFLSYALLLGILIQRSGLTILMLLFSNLIEFFIKARLPDDAEFIKPFFPMESMSNLVSIPFPRYVFMEIQDYVSGVSVAIVLVWLFLFNYLAYRKLKHSDI